MKMKKIKKFALIATLSIVFFICGGTARATTVDSKSSEAVVGFYKSNSSISSSDSSEKDNVTEFSNNGGKSNRDSTTSFPKTGSENQNYLIIIGLFIIGFSTLNLLQKKKESETK
jgi:LPXTG-motif cell wall-anchored protein